MIKCYECDGVGEKYYERMIWNEYDAGSYECPVCDGVGKLEETLNNVCQALWASRCNALYAPSKEPEWHPHDELPQGFDNDGCMYLYVKISGDSESIDGHVLYDYPDYCTLMGVQLITYEDEEITYEMSGTGFTDEDWDYVMEWAYISPEHFEELKQEARKLYAAD